MPPSSARKRYSHLCITHQHVSSSENTPSSSAHLSPMFDLAHEYTLALHTNSYSDIWSKIHRTESSYIETHTGDTQANEEQNASNPVLDPSQESVKETLQNATPNKFTPLFTAYFDHSERTSHLCLLLHDSIIRARVIYHDIHKITNCFPLDSDVNSLSESQCDWAFNVFLRFNQFDNPFPQPGSESLCDIRHCFFQLNQQIHHKLRKSRSRAQRLRRVTTCSSTWFIGPLIPSFHPSRVPKKERDNLSQLNAAARGTFVLHDLDTIDRLVDRLYSSFEGDKFLVRLGLERGRDRNPMYEVAKQLKKNQSSFLLQLEDLEEHICLCFTVINRARGQLLDEIRLQQSHSC